MKFRSLLSVLLSAVGLVTVTACRAFVDDSPSEVTDKALAAMKKCDFGKVADLSHGGMVQDVQGVSAKLAQIRESAKGGDRNAQNVLNELETGLKAETFEISGEKVTGDFAEVDFVIVANGGKTPSKSYLQKVGGGWKLISDHEYFQAHPDKVKQAAPGFLTLFRRRHGSKAAKPAESKPAEAKPAK